MIGSRDISPVLLPEGPLAFSTQSFHGRGYFPDDSQDCRIGQLKPTPRAAMELVEALIPSLGRNHCYLPAGDTLGEEAFPDFGARGSSPPGIKTLNQQPQPFIDPDTAIGRGKQDRSLLAVNQGGKTEIHGEDRIPFSCLPSPDELAPPAVEARDTDLSFLGKGTDTLGRNSKTAYQLSLGMKLLKSGEEGKPSFGCLHSLDPMPGDEICQSPAQRAMRKGQSILSITMDRRKAGKKPGTAGMASHEVPAFLPGLGSQEKV